MYAGKAQMKGGGEAKKRKTTRKVEKIYETRHRVKVKWNLRRGKSAAYNVTATTPPKHPNTNTHTHRSDPFCKGYQ